MGPAYRYDLAMRVVIFGATGMVGQGVLRECLLDPRVSEVVSVGRRPIGRTAAKLRELVRDDVADLGPVESELTGVDACFFCLGVSSAGMSEPLVPGRHLRPDAGGRPRLWPG